MCKVCGNDKCSGKYLLHPKEFHMIPEIKKKELLENPNRTFILVNSPGNLHVQFKELHVIDN